MKIKINNRIYEAQEDETIIDVCRREGIRIPTLCAFEGLPREAVCRLCLVKINLTDKLVTSCTLKVCEKLEVTTESERINKARKINLELLWSDHAGKCATCKKNRMCELQTLAEEYKIENFHFIPKHADITDIEERDLLRDNKIRVVVENENPAISRTTEFCVECRRCINTCPEKKFGFNNRSSDVVVGTPYNEILDCSFCGECVRVCPTAALTDQNDYKKMIEELDDLQKLSVAILDAGMKEKIFGQIKDITQEKNIEKILQSLGFEKIVALSKKEAENEDETIKSIKTEYARKEKIDPKKIRTFLISSKVYKKAEKNEYLDYVLSEREVARLVRDKDKVKAGKIKR